MSTNIKKTEGQPSNRVFISINNYQVDISVVELTLALTLITFLIVQLTKHSKQLTKHSKQFLATIHDADWRMRETLDIKTIELREMCGADRCLIIFFHGSRFSALSEAVKSGATELYSTLQNKRIVQVATEQDRALYTGEPNELTFLTTLDKRLSTKHRSFLRAFGVTFSVNLLLRSENKAKPFGVLTLQYCSGYTAQNYRDYSDQVLPDTVRLAIKINSSAVHYKVSEILAAIQSNGEK